ncbi:MAG: hypothetical protein V3T20_05485, partial [Gemmatimonadota bacterium]
MKAKTRSARRSHAARFGPTVLAILCAPGLAQAQICPDIHSMAGGSIDKAPTSGLDVVRIVAVGDIMMGTTFPDSTYLDPRIVPGVKVEDLIGADLVDLLRSGDIVFGNLEGALFDGEG